MKKKNIPAAILLSIFTFGIYSLYWFVCLTDDSNKLSSHDKTADGGTALLFTIITLGIYRYYWAYKLAKKLDDSEVVYIILEVCGLGIINNCLAQTKINEKIEDNAVIEVK